jgi:hypothetical protein
MPSTVTGTAPYHHNDLKHLFTHDALVDRRALSDRSNPIPDPCSIHTYGEGMLDTGPLRSPIIVPMLPFAKRHKIDNGKYYFSSPYTSTSPLAPK